MLTFGPPTAEPALRVGATRLTFHDEEVTDFLSPQAQGKSVMFPVLWEGAPGEDSH